MLLIVLAVIVIASFGTGYFQRRYSRRRESPPESDVVNTTNYNIDRAEKSELADLSPEEAEAVLKKWKDTGYVPSEHDYYQVQRALKKRD